ncbi:MAG TPA: serine protease [Dehalococcoidia bacterium]|nr:serine protease [Dehalococcoidia bacterium]
MKILGPILLLGLILGCSSRAVVVQPAEQGRESLSLSLALIGRFGLAHSCPVDGLVLTAAHVAVHRDMFGNETPNSYLWEQGPINGLLTGYVPLASRDLAQLLPDSESLPPMASRADSGPSQGESVYWQQFNMVSDPMRQEIQRGRVTDIGPGHFAFEPEPKDGASGGCIFNETGEVLGIVVWSLGDNSLSRDGVAVTLTGQWWPGS